MKAIKLAGGESAQIFRVNGVYIAVYLSNAGPEAIAIDESLPTVRVALDNWIDRYFDAVEDLKHTGARYD